MAEYPNLLTYQDVMEHLLAKEQASMNHSLIRSAIKDCYEVDLPQRPAAGKWKHYITEHDLRIYGSYDTGTITFDYTGGASERLLTFSTALTGNPLTDLIYYRIRIASLNYQISTLLSSTTAQLAVNSNPGADVAAGTSFTLYRNRYTLPPDFVSMYEPLHETDWGMQYLSPATAQNRERHSWGEEDQPTEFTIMPDPDVFGQMAIMFPKAPSADRGLRFLYYRTPRAIKYHGYEEDIRATTCSGTASTNTVTLSSSTIANSDWVGRFIRFYDTSNYPTGLKGRYAYKEQHVITAVSGSTMTLAANLANTYASSTKYTITDPMDIRPTMNLALLRGCEWQLSIILNREDQNAFARYIDAVRSAGDSDDVMESVRMSMQHEPGWRWYKAPTETS